MVDIEKRVRELRTEIIRCIKEPSIVSLLEASGVISIDDSSRLKTLYLNGETYKAGEKLLDCVFDSKEPGKWKSFEDALNGSDYLHLRTLLMSPDSHDNSYVHASAILRVFTPLLEKTVLGEQIVTELKSRGVINDTDQEHVLAMCANKGHTYATIVLLDRMQCRKSPEHWYYEFLSTLMVTDHQDVIEKIEPDFLQNPSAFMPKKGPIFTSGEYPEKASMDSERVVSEERGACGSIREHVITDYVEEETDTNDLEGPPVPPPRQESLSAYTTSLQIDSNTSNFMEMNIKPEMMKAVSHELANPDDRHSIIDDDNECNNDDDDDDDDEDDSMASDYEMTEEETASDTHMQLRNYQLELAENAVLGRNTIICAEAGSGKTWVALHITKKHLQEATNGPKKVAFMARTGVLIKQQCDRFKKYLADYQTKLMSAEDEESRMLNMLLPDYDILCFTPQILVNSLDNNSIPSLSQFSLLILDECHHTRGDEPYNILMRKYLVEQSNGNKDLPQVIGLTASIGVGKSRTEEETVEYILNVCACLDVRILSTVERHTEELRKHTNVPDEETIALVKQTHDPCRDVIIIAMEETEDWLKDNSLMQPKMIDLMDIQPRDRESQEYNKWTVDVMKAAMFRVDDDNMSRDIRACARYLNTYNSALEVNKLLLTRDIIKYLAEKHVQEGEHRNKLTEMERNLYSHLQGVQKKLNTRGKNTENPNVRILSNTLRKMLDDKGDASRAMVFVKARATCRSLAAFLDKDLQTSGVSTSHLFGKENRGGDNGMTDGEQTDILEKFRVGFYKVLVCTSVGNEGIDIPECNIVLSYEYSGDEITKIQMKGRARKKEATTIMMGSEKVVELDKFNTYKAAMMYRALNKVKQLDPKYVNKKVTQFQKEEMQKYRYKVEIEKLKKRQKSDEDYEILCGRCNVFVCYVSDVRKLGHDHIVIDKSFADKITRKEHKRPKTYDGLHKKYKMFCKKCPLDWGIIGIRDGLDLMILKIINFKFRHLRTRGISAYKKWIEMPYNVPEIDLADLPTLLGPVRESTEILYQR